MKKRIYNSTINIGDIEINKIISFEISKSFNLEFDIHISKISAVFKVGLLGIITWNIGLLRPGYMKMRILMFNISILGLGFMYHKRIGDYPDTYQ